MARAKVWLRGNTMLIQLGMLVSLGDAEDAPLTDELTGTVITDATVTATVYDATGTPASGQTWPLAIAAVSGGVYRGAASYNTALALGPGAVCEIIADKSGNRGKWRIPLLVEDRAA